MIEVFGLFLLWYFCFLTGVFSLSFSFLAYVLWDFFPLNSCLLFLPVLSKRLDTSGDLRHFIFNLSEVKSLSRV